MNDPFWMVVCSDGGNRRFTRYPAREDAEADLPLFDQECDAFQVFGVSPCPGGPHRVEAIGPKHPGDAR